MNKAGIGVEIELKENGKLKAVPLSKEAGEKLKKMFGKSPQEYLEEYIDDKEAYSKFDEDYKRLKTECLPENLDCAFCKELSTLDEDKACGKYYLQMDITFHLCADYFVYIVKKNSQIFTDKKSLKILAGHFLKNFHFLKGRGVLWFDSFNFQRNMLEEGFIELSMKFNNMPINDAIRTINDTKEVIEIRQTLDKLYERADPNFLALQRRFFKTKLNHYLTKQKIQEIEKNSVENCKVNNENSTETTRLHIALFAYYTHKGGYKLYPELSFPSVKFWEKIASDYGRHFKQIQLHYNKINKTENRLSFDKEKAIRYVAEEMLNEYPKAKALAFDELKLIR